MTALDAKIVPFPAAELMPKSPSNPQSQENLPEESASRRFRGGGFRGLFWALLLEGSVILLAAGVVMTWHVLRH